MQLPKSFTITAVFCLTGFGGCCLSILSVFGKNNQSAFTTAHLLKRTMVLNSVLISFKLSFIISINAPFNTSLNVARFLNSFSLFGVAYSFVGELLKLQNSFLSCLFKFCIPCLCQCGFWPVLEFCNTNHCSIFHMFWNRT